jgi:hypothetical protein
MLSARAKVNGAPETIQQNFCQAVDTRPNLDDVTMLRIARPY